MTDSHEAEVDPVAPVDIAIAEDVWGRGFEALRSRFSIAHVPTAWEDPDVLAALVAGARALVVRNRTALTRSLLLGAPRLEVVARAGTGTDNIDVLAADELGIVVVAATGANARSVAEHSLCLALALARDLEGHERRLRQGLWERPLGVELAGRTWGLVGLGATGGAVGRLARSIGMKVLGHDPYLSEEARTHPGVPTSRRPPGTRRSFRHRLVTRPVDPRVGRSDRSRFLRAHAFRFVSHQRRTGRRGGRTGLGRRAGRRPTGRCRPGRSAAGASKAKQIGQS